MSTQRGLFLVKTRGIAKIGAFCLLIAAVFLLISGCGRREEERGITLTFAHGALVEHARIWEELATIFEARHAHIRIKRIAIARNFYGKIMTMIAGDTAPDIMWMGQSFSEFASRGAFLDLTSRIEEEIDIDAFYSRVVEWYRYDGRLYGFPYSIDMDMLFFNQDLFDEAGLAHPNEDWTVKELVEAAQKLTLRDERGRIKQFGYVGGYDLGPFGGRLLNDEGTKSALDSPEAIQALQFNIDLGKKYKVSPVGGVGGEAGETGMTPAMLFQTGRVAMFRGYTWLLSEFRRNITAFDWDVTLMPIAQRRSHWASSGGYAISSQTRHPEEAWLFLKFLISPEAQRLTSAVALPVSREVALEVIKEHTGHPANMQAFLEAIPYLEPFPRISALTKVLGRYWAAKEKARLGLKTPEEAFKEASREIDNILEEARLR